MYTVFCRGQGQAGQWLNIAAEVLPIIFLHMVFRDPVLIYLENYFSLIKEKMQGLNTNSFIVVSL